MCAHLQLHCWHLCPSSSSLYNYLNRVEQLKRITVYVGNIMFSIWIPTMQLQLWVTKSFHHIYIMLNKNTLGVKKCEANQRQHANR